MNSQDTVRSCGIVVLISGSGTNLQAIIDAIDADDIAGRITAVISNRPDAAGLERARRAGIPTEVLDHREFEDRATFDEAMAGLIDRYAPDLIVLAGFMRILTDTFVTRYTGRMLNIHPSLLPAYRGLNTHARALADGADEHGSSVHFVTPELDGGPVIIQAGVPLHPDDTPEQLAARVLEKEHIIYPMTVGWFCAGRLRLVDNAVVFDGQTLTQPLRLEGLPPHERPDGKDLASSDP